MHWKKSATTKNYKQFSSLNLSSRRAAAESAKNEENLLFYVFVCVKKFREKNGNENDTKWDDSELKKTHVIHIEDDAN
jgi:hypothetical protein